MKEVDPYAYRRVISCSPALSIATTTASFSPTHLLGCDSASTSRASRTNSINTLPINELSLSQVDPEYHELGDEIKQEIEQQLPGVTMTRQNALGNVQLSDAGLRQRSANEITV